MRLLVALAAAAISTTAVAQEDVDGSLARLQPAARSALVELLDLALADGPTARVRNVRSLDGSDLICGLVNAKNKMGGYPGYKHFIAAAGLKVVYLDGGTDPRDVAYTLKPTLDSLCKG